MTPDTVWPALAIIVPSFCSVLGAVVIAYMQNKTKQAVLDTGTAAAFKVAEVKTELRDSNVTTDATLKEIKKTGVDTHTLVNSNMGVQLRLNAAVTGRLAEITKDPEDIKAANLARLMYEEHVAKQAIVDSGKKL